MKTTRYTLLAAALLLAASCANDPVEDIINPSAPGTALPGGTFVIDYTAGMEGADTRNDLPANQRIQSLDYLIYQSTEDGTYTLLKKKSIPGIGPDTKWPLTRKDMTWEQREALKDTLSTDKNYKMVFVANADDDIWNPAGTSDFHALQNVEINSDFNDGRLVLPPRVFKENDMYYMWTETVTPPDEADEADEDQTVRKEVLLQRMINKVEVKLDENIPTDKTELETYTKKLLKTYIDKNIKKETVEGETFTGSIFADLQSYMGKWGGKIKLESWSTYDDALEQFMTLITSDNSINTIITDITTNHTETPYTFYEQEMLEKIKEVLYWKDFTNVTVHYASNTYGNKLTFSKETIVDEASYAFKGLTVSNNSFTYYTFPNNTTTDKINMIEKLTFKKEGKEEEITIYGDNFPQSICEEGNREIIFYCNPAKDFCERTSLTFINNSYNLKNVLQWQPSDVGLGEIRLPYFEKEVNESLESSGESLESMKLSIDIPSSAVSSWESNISE